MFVRRGNTTDHVAMIRLLVDSGPSPTLKDKRVMAPLQVAAERGNHRMLEALLGRCGCGCILKHRYCY